MGYRAAKIAIEPLGKIYGAEATPAATRQEFLNGFMSCLEAKEDMAVIQASAELGEVSDHSLLWPRMSSRADRVSLFGTNWQDVRRQGAVIDVLAMDCRF